MVEEDDEEEPDARTVIVPCMYAGWNWQWYGYTPGVVKTIGEDEDRPDMSPVSKLNVSPGFDVNVWSAVSAFFITRVLLTPIINTMFAGAKLISDIPAPDGATMKTCAPGSA